MNPDFNASCCLLADRILDSGFHPDLIIGIATGGDYVAARLAASSELKPRLGILSVRLQRPSTRTKNRLAPIISRIPKSVTPLLRRLEHHARILSDSIRRPGIPQTLLSPEILTLLAENPRCTILVADDAVDSGRTLLSIIQALRKAAPESQIRTAAITVTRRNPCILPDYSLYSSLIRFPWSLDSP